MSGKLPSACLDQLFRNARTHDSLTGNVPALLHELVDLLKLGPTSANCSATRFLFVKSWEAKEKLKSHLCEGNRDFFASINIKSNFLCNLGYGYGELFPRSPRFSFDEMAKII